MTYININGAALRAIAATRSADVNLSTAMQRLSTGKRINSAKDDGAGLTVSSAMTAQILGMRQGMRNAVDGASLVQTADGVLSETVNMAQRIRELTLQSLSETNGASDRAAMQTEVLALASQIGGSLRSADFNGKPLFDTNQVYYDGGAQLPGQGTSFVIQAGASLGDAIAITLPKVPLSYSRVTNFYLTTPTIYPGSATHLVTFEDYTARGKVGGKPIALEDIGNTVNQMPGDEWYDASRYSITGKSSTLSFEQEINVTNRYRSENTLVRVDEFLANISAARSALGASASRLDSASNNLSTASMNLEASRSRIEDADFSSETTALAKAQILKQASTAMLAQANQSQQSIMKLLGN